MSYEHTPMEVSVVQKRYEINTAGVTKIVEWQSERNLRSQSDALNDMLEKFDVAKELKRKVKK